MDVGRLQEGGGTLRADRDDDLMRSSLQLGCVQGYSHPAAVIHRPYRELIIMETLGRIV